MVLVNPLKSKTPQWDCKGIAGGMFTYTYIWIIIDNFMGFTVFFLLPIEWNLKVKPLKKKNPASFSIEDGSALIKWNTGDWGFSVEKNCNFGPC